MKHIFYLLLLCMSCKNANPVKLEGIYTASFEHEFGRTTDTLVVEKINQGNGVYRINRHSGVIRKLDGKEFPKELIIQTWWLDYDADKQALNERKEGRLLVWNNEKQVLVLGNREYHKLK